MKTYKVFGEKYSLWKISCTFLYVEGLWKRYLLEKPGIPFEEYVSKDNHYNCMSTARFLISIWKEERRRREIFRWQP